MYVPKSHPRYQSLMMRERIADGVRKGLVHETGMIAHGRGEAFDYLIGEKTIDPADEAAGAAAAYFKIAKNAVISVNGNVAVLAGKECIELAEAANARIEVNLFHRTEERVKKIIKFLEEVGGENILGMEADARIPGLEHDRGKCCTEGIYSADVVLVPLEDGDRCEALKKMGKIVIAIDLNPLSRTSRAADVTIVDNVVRAVPNIKRHFDRKEKCDQIKRWDNKKCLQDCLDYINDRLSSFYEPE
ncbi:MAG: 4-phosphopantoate--beta-alanine ligase [Candidatus Thermoplasmatota archaeon]|nr:4-phosphopantoate--beta-alanine ligase [Candidatus Thermoplasmatota archaeon]